MFTGLLFVAKTAALFTRELKINLKAATAKACTAAESTHSQRHKQQHDFYTGSIPQLQHQLWQTQNSSISRHNTHYTDATLHTSS